MALDGFFGSLDRFFLSITLRNQSRERGAGDRIAAFFGR